MTSLPNPIPLRPAFTDGLRLRTGTRAANAFERAVVARVLASATPVERNVVEVARGLYGDDKPVLRLVNRAASAPMTTGNSGAIVPNEVMAFALNLPGSAASRLFAAGIAGSLAGVGQVAIPRVAGALPTLPTVDEGDPIAVVMLQLASATLGPATKAAVLAAFTRELARSSMAEAAIVSILREAAALTLDTLVFGTQVGTAARPAGLLNGVTPIAATAGGTTAAATDDLTNLIGAVAAAGGAQVVIIAGPRAAVGLKLRFPEIENSYPIWPSLGVPTDTIIAVDASVFVAAFGPDPTLEASQETALHHEDTTPLQLGVAGDPATVAAPVRSAFQTGMVVLRLVLDIAFVLREPDRIAVVNGATWA